MLKRARIFIGFLLIGFAVGAFQATAAQAMITKQEGFDKLRGRVGDDDIQRYINHNNLAGLSPCEGNPPFCHPYYYRYSNSRVIILLGFTFWNGYHHSVCGFADEGNRDGDFIQGCTVPLWTPWYS